MARVMTSGSVSKAGRPALGGSEESLSFHQSSTNTYNETKKESRSSMAPSFGESLVHQHTILAPSLFFAITHQTSKVPSRDRSRRRDRPGGGTQGSVERDSGTAGKVGWWPSASQSSPRTPPPSTPTRGRGCRRRLRWSRRSSSDGSRIIWERG